MYELCRCLWCTWECVCVLAFNQHNTHAHSQCLFNSIFTLLSLCDEVCACMCVWFCVWLCVSLCVCVCVMCFFIYTFHLLSFWALQSQRRHLPGTPRAFSLLPSPSLSVSVCVCVSVLAAIVVVAVAIVVIRAARFTEPADRSPRFPHPPLRS